MLLKLCTLIHRSIPFFFVKYEQFEAELDDFPALDALISCFKNAEKAGLEQKNLPKQHELLEIHRSKISLDSAKQGYNYPTMRWPHTFSKLAGTAHASLSDGSRRSASVSRGHFNYRKSFRKSQILRLHTAEVRSSNLRGPIVLFTIGYCGAAHWTFVGYENHG